MKLPGLHNRPDGTECNYLCLDAFCVKCGYGVPRQAAPLSVVIPWKKHAKQRPRSGRGHTYTPKATTDAEKIIRDNFLEAVGPDFKMYDGPIGVDVHMTKDKLRIEIWPMHARDNNSLNGDIDNYLKTVLDALNGVAYVDDKQIDVLTGEKT